MNNIHFGHRAAAEFKSYFDSPVAYIVLTFFLIITGYFFTSNLFLANQADLRTLWGIVPLLFVFFIPALSMKLLAEEKKSGTIELLYTYPIKDSEIVVGKYLAALGLLGVLGCVHDCLCHHGWQSGEYGYRASCCGIHRIDLDGGSLSCDWRVCLISHGQSDCRVYSGAVYFVLLLYCRQDSVFPAAVRGRNF